MHKFFIIVILSPLLNSCFSSEESKKENEIVLVDEQSEIDNGEKLETSTKPNTVLITGSPEHRLVTVYKEKVSKDGKRRYIDGNYYHSSHPDYYISDINEWHDHYLPGIEAVYGYNMFNVAHYNTSTNQKNFLFENSVLINTLYFPSYLQDTLNNDPVNRDYYMISVYDEDTNNDSIINYLDLRRLYHFDINGKNQQALIPKDYSVVSSEYDSQIDVLYIFAKFDENKNGKKDLKEPTHIFTLDLKNPEACKRLF